jgi:hypothetical protein
LSPPTGYKDTADAWVNTGALVGRMNSRSTLANAGVGLIVVRDRDALADGGSTTLLGQNFLSPHGRQSSERSARRRRSRWRSALEFQRR